MRPDALRAMVAALLLGLSGCNWYYDRLPSPDDLMKVVPWFDHMITTRAVFPYARADVPRTSVPGTVPVSIIHSLAFLYGPGLSVIAIVAIIILSRYRIDRDRHAEIMRELVKRREAKLAAAPVSEASAAAF